MSLSDSLGDSPVSESDSNTGFSGRNQRSDFRGSVASAIFQAPLRARRKKTALTQAVPGQVPTPTPLRRAWCDMMRLLAAPKNWSTADVQIKPIRSMSTSPKHIYYTKSCARWRAFAVSPSTTCVPTPPAVSTAVLASRGRMSIHGLHLL